jgi:hypothetical protein
MTTSADYPQELAERIAIVAAEECSLEDLEDYVRWSIHWVEGEHEYPAPAYPAPATTNCIMQQVYAYRVGLIERTWFVVATKDGTFEARYKHGRR